MTLLFWGCAAYVVYAYVGFPLLTILRGRFRPRPYRRAEIEPSVSLLVAAYNEAGVIEDRIRNALALDYPPERLETSAVVTFQPGEGITKGALTVRATVPGIDAGAFDVAAETARKSCPVSKALTGIPEISLDAQLAG